jgi:serine/threonine-protein kinase HipA
VARMLDVYFHSNLVGHLIQDDGGQMVFDYSETWIESPTSIPLSQSLPLRKERFTRNECQGFFAGILPEEGKRETIAHNLGITPKNDHAMLEQIGGECAGAVTFVPAGGPLPEKNYHYRKLGDEELATILKALPHRPLMTGGDEGVRLSLAGVQDKIAVHINGENISLPLGGAPSTHILKPAIERFEGVVFNEAICMKLADKVGLPTAQVEICTVEGIDFLMVERYDRTLVPGGLFGPPIMMYETKRLHQEDFCQALAVPPHKKYQSEGGPSLKQCFDLVREVSSVPAIDLQCLLDAVVFNILIGNNDAHSKNFSLLYDESPSLTTRLLENNLLIKLAPLYDLVSTAYYPELSPKMAMKLGEEYISDKLLPKHFERLAEETGFAKKMAVKRVLEFTEIVKEAMNDIDIDHKVAHEVTALIKNRCELFSNRFRS